MHGVPLGQGTAHGVKAPRTEERATRSGDPVLSSLVFSNAARMNDTCLPWQQFVVGGQQAQRRCFCLPYGLQAHSSRHLFIKYLVRMTGTVGVVARMSSPSAVKNTIGSAPQQCLGCLGKPKHASHQGPVYNRNDRNDHRSPESIA